MTNAIDLYKCTHSPTQTTKERVRGMTFAGITQEIQAEILNISVDVLRHYYRPELNTSQAGMIYAVSTTAAQMALAGNTEMIKLILKTKGSNYGWQEKQVVEVGISKELDTLSQQLAALEQDNLREY